MEAKLYWPSALCRVDMVVIAVQSSAQLSRMTTRPAASMVDDDTGLERVITLGDDMEHA